MSGHPTKKIVDGNVTTEVFDLSGGQAGSIDPDDILERIGGQGGSYTETRPDGTKVTYEVDVEEYEEEEEIDEPLFEEVKTYTTTKSSSNPQQKKQFQH